MNKLLRWLSSPGLALMLLLLFGTAMAVATFVENDFGTSTAWQLIYDSWWFELLMLGLGVCFVLNIKKYRLYQPKKWAILMFHLAFIVILIGAAITRYYSYGGVMRIREGESSNILISSENFLQAHFSTGSEDKIFKKAYGFNTISNNDFGVNLNISEKPISIDYVDYITDAVPQVVTDEAEGTDILELVWSDGAGRNNIFLKSGELTSANQTAQHISFNAPKEGLVNIWEEDGVLKIKSPRPLSSFEMATEVAGIIGKDTVSDLKYRTLYRDGDVSFVPLAFHKQSKVVMVSGAEKPKDNDETKEDILVVKVSDESSSKELQIPYNEGLPPKVISGVLNDVNFDLSYGSELIELPFAIKLFDFQLERYPGSTSPSSYASEVEVIDQEGDYAYRIFMNNVLDHKGYRFFQASYDTDERGTVLAVNYDFLGTYITYLGYFLMMVGMFFTLFGKSSRFHLINKRLKQLKKRTVLSVLFAAACFGTINSQEKTSVNKIQSVNIVNIDEANLGLFSRLLVQDLDGRIKPVHTLSSELMRKVSRRPYYRYYQSESSWIKLTPSQVFLGMMSNPAVWESMPIIKVDPKKLGTLLDGVKISTDDFVAFNQLISSQGQYIFAKEVEQANKKVPAERSETDKELIKVDERFNILYNVFVGNYLIIFPNKNDLNNKWHSYNYHFNDFPTEDARFASQIIPQLFQDIKINKWESVFQKLEYIKTYQDVLGASIIPSRKLIESEILYNNLNLNFWLFQVLFTLGALLLVLAISSIFTRKRWMSSVWNSAIILTLLSFVLFTTNLILRWYVAGHAPWSNGYEMLVFVAWVLLLCGLITFRKSDFALPLATLFAGALLFVSYLDWLSPEITNLMPVLKSFWLKVHVATIVSSYAPLALSAVLGFMALILMIIKKKGTTAVIDVKIKELSYINEISMTIGLFVLSVGTFLGGIWANESWGRYWAWDPKETWALISIIVYAIVLHLRFVPKLNNDFTLSAASVVAFSSIIMTSFGVNYYLSGLHSYAAGDPIPIPTFVYYLVGIILVIIGLAYYKRNGVTHSNPSLPDA